MDSSLIQYISTTLPPPDFSQLPLTSPLPQIHSTSVSEKSMPPKDNCQAGGNKTKTRNIKTGQNSPLGGKKVPKAGQRARGTLAPTKTPS